MSCDPTVGAPVYMRKATATREAYLTGQCPVDQGEDKYPRPRRNLPSLTTRLHGISAS